MLVCFMLAPSADNRQNVDVIAAADRTLQNRVDQLAFEAVGRANAPDSSQRSADVKFHKNISMP
jgi:hypothetical protein